MELDDDTDEDSLSSEDSEPETLQMYESDELSDAESNSESNRKQPCKYYNRGRCRDGANCSYPHVCKSHLQGNCLYGATCRLSHSVGAGGGGRRGGGGGGGGGGAFLQTANAPRLSDGRSFQWQLNSGSGWKDIENDHVIEAQYSLPHSKSMKLYNTPYGAVSIDFSQVRVVGKQLQVRRLDDGRTTWFWFCTLSRKWMKYGEKNSKGHSSPVSSTDIENNFQKNPSGSFSFTMGGNTVEIKFREMIQVGQSQSQRRRRRVTRRPQFRNKLMKRGLLMAPTNMASVGSRPQWEFEGDRGAWHVFKSRGGTSTQCSITSDTIETKFQQNPASSLTFSVSGYTYKLDFTAMVQINMQTQRTRRIRRVLV